MVFLHLEVKREFQVPKSCKLLPKIYLFMQKYQNGMNRKVDFCSKNFPTNLNIK